MKTNELRTGNYMIDVFDKRNPEITKLTLDDFQCMNNYIRSDHSGLLPYKPIELTEELVIKFGATLDFKSADSTTYRLNDFIIVIDHEITIYTKTVAFLKKSEVCS